MFAPSRSRHDAIVTDAPFRDRALSPEEVRRAIERAASLAKVDVAAGKTGRSMTGAELERHLFELGLDRASVRRAMEPAETRVTPSGLTHQVVREVAVEGELSAAHLEEIAEEIASVMKMEGQTAAVGQKLVWTPGGRLVEPAVTVHAKDGETRIRFVETLQGAAPAVISFATLSTLAGLMATGVGTVGGVAIAKALEIGASEGSPFVFSMAALLGVGGAIASFVALWRRYRKHGEQRTAFADEVVARVASAVRARIEGAAPKARVEVGEVEPEGHEIAAGKDARRSNPAD
jgi:hypothetical protein